MDANMSALMAINDDLEVIGSQVVFDGKVNSMTYIDGDLFFCTHKDNSPDFFLFDSNTL